MPKLNGQRPLPASVPVPRPRPASATSETPSAPPTPAVTSESEPEETTLWQSKSTKATPRLSFLDTPPPAAPSPRATLLLMSLRDELSRRRTELLNTPKTPENQPLIETDLGLISQAADMVHESLSGTRDLPAGFLTDASEAVQALVSAEPGGALEQLKQPTLSQDVNTFARTLSEQAGQPVPNIYDTFATVMGGYTNVVGAVDEAIPDLPFPVTLPVPLAYDNGNTAFVLPAGSQISSDENGLQVSTPGFLALNDGTQIFGQNVSLNLGEELDGLQVDQLLVNTGQSATLVEGAVAGISREDQSAIIAAETVAYDNESGQFLLKNARIRQHTSGTDADFEKLFWNNDSNTGSVGQTALRHRIDNETAYLTAETHQLNVLTEHQILQADTLKLGVEQGPEGQKLAGSGTELRFSELGPEGVERHIEAGAASISVVNEANGAGHIELTGQDIRYAEGDLAVNADGESQVSLTRNAAGFVESVSAQGERLSYQNAGESAELVGAEARLSFNEQGQLTALNAQLENGQLQGAFGEARLEGGALALNYEQGHLSRLNGQVEQLQFQDQDHALDLQGFGLEANFNADGSLHESNLHLAQGQVQTPELNAAVSGLNAEISSAQSSLHVDSAAVKSQLESDWNVTVENLDLVMQNAATGQGASVDLAVGDTEAFVSGFNARIRTENGDQVRLHVGISEDGNFLQEAFLQVPGGGEIQLAQDDLNVRLGGGETGQKLSFAQDGAGKYTFTGEGLNIDAATRDASVSVRGGRAQVSVDATRGDLIIEDITGLGIDANVAGQDLNISIAEMDGFLVKATGVSGLAEGAALHLIPTHDNAVIQAEIRTDYNGIPLRVKLDDVHELKAAASIQPNKARVYFGDPSGRGQVELSAGPLSMKGSAIEWTAQYHTFDPQRMMSNVSRALSSDGFELAPGVQVELDGVLRLQTPFKKGPHAGLTLLFPRPQMGMDTGLSQHQNLPVNTSSPEDGAMGAIAQVGWRHTNRAGTSYTTGLHGGLVSGSYLNIQQNQGETYLGGMKLPTKNINLPTTAMAGVSFSRHASDEAVASGKGSRLDLMTGVYVNPAGLVDSPYVSEDNAYGVYGGVEYRQKNRFVGFGSSVGLSGEKPNVNAQVRFGINF